MWSKLFKYFLFFFKYFHLRHLSFPCIHFYSSEEYYLEVSEHMVVRIMYVTNRMICRRRWAELWESLESVNEWREVKHLAQTLGNQEHCVSVHSAYALTAKPWLCTKGAKVFHFIQWVSRSNCKIITNAIPMKVKRKFPKC